MASWLRRWFGSPPAADVEAREASPVAQPAPERQASSRALDVDGAFHRWLLDAHGEDGAAASADEHALYEALVSAAEDPRLVHRVPRVPAIVPQLLQMLRDPSHQATDISRRVAQDAVLVAAVLRVANSPWYATGRRIESLEQALLILGQDGLRQIVASVAMKPLINVQSGHFTRVGAPRVWDQSERACAACRLLARGQTGAGFEAYLAILLTNVASIVALRVLDERYHDGLAPVSDAFCAALGAVIRDLAGTIGRQWEFPPAVVAALGSEGTPSSPLVHAAERASRCRVLVDARCVTAEDARRALSHAPAAAACFEALATAA